MEFLQDFEEILDENTNDIIVKYAARPLACIFTDRIDDIKLELNNLFKNLRNDLDNFGKRLAAELVGKDALEIKEAIDAKAIYKPVEAI